MPEHVNVASESDVGLRRDLQNGGNPGRSLTGWGEASMARKRILVVEDNEDNRRILLYRLRKIGDFDIVETSNGEEAVAAVEAKPPDLIFMDLKMPIMDGWEATRRIRALEVGKSIPIIALTAQAMAGDEQKALANGCNDYLAKPVVDPSLVREKVERLLGVKPNA